MVDDLADGAFFDDAAGVHHGNAVGILRNDAHVVRNEEDGGSRLFGHVLENGEHLGLHGHVQGGRRFVGDNQLWLWQERHHDAHALEHAAREFVRVRIQNTVGVGKTG